MQPTAIQFALLGLTSPMVLLRSLKASRQLSAGDSEDAVLALLNVCHTLESRPAEPTGRDPIDESIRLIRSARHSRVHRLHKLIATAYTRLTPDARRDLRTQLGPSLIELVAVLSRDESELSRRSAVDLAHDSAEPSLLPCVVSLVEDSDPAVATGAQNAVLELATRLADRRYRGILNPKEDKLALSVVLASCDRFPEHRSTQVTDAAILLLDPLAIQELSPDRPGQWLQDRDEAARFGLRASLRRVAGPIGRLRAWQFLIEPEFRKSAIERLLVDQIDTGFDAVLGQAHLGIRAARNRPIRSRITRAQRPSLFPSPDDIEGLGAQARRGLCHWLDVVQPDAQETDAMLEPMLADPDPAARLSVVRRAPASLLRDLAFDNTEVIGHSASLRLLHTGQGAPAVDFCNILKKSPHASVRELMQPRQVLGRESIAARRKLAADRTATLDTLRTKLLSGDEFDITESVRFIRRLGIASELTHELIETLERAFGRDDSPAWRVISSILALVPELPHPSVARLLAAARAHNDARIRANAIEAEPRRPRGRASSMIELLQPACDDQHHRVRTSALRVLLKGENAPADTVDRVLSTLGERDQASRAAALWLVERSVVELRPVAGKRWAHLAARIAEIAQSGDEPTERARATRCARRMLSEMRS